MQAKKKKIKKAVAANLMLNALVSRSLFLIMFNINMKIISANLVETIKKFVFFEFLNKGNKKIVNKNIHQNGSSNTFVGGDFKTNRYKLRVRGALIDEKKGVVKMELYKVYENGETELVKNPYWSMYVPDTQGGWIYDYQKLQNIKWGKNDQPFSEVAVSLYDKDHNRPEDMAYFSYGRFLKVFKNN